MENLIFIALGFVSGIVISNGKGWYLSYKVLRETHRVYKSIYDKLKKGEIEFINRVNHHVIMRTKIPKLGSITFIYDMNESLLIVSKRKQVRYTSHPLQSTYPVLKLNIVVDNIIRGIRIAFGSQIDDVVDINGQLINRTFFETQVNNTMNNIENAIQHQGLIFTPISPENFVARKTKVKSPYDGLTDQEALDMVLDKLKGTSFAELTVEEQNILKNAAK